jgi:Super-infection exclusion protein B
MTEAFKAALSTGGWYKLAVTAAAGLYWIGARLGHVPDAQPWELRLSAALFLFFGLLTVANLATVLGNFLRPGPWIVTQMRLQRAQRAVRDYIPHMTEQEKQIVAYLLAKHQKMFRADRNGGYAATLLSRGIIRVAAQQGQYVDIRDVPMEVPDYAWKVLLQHKDQFPYDGRNEDREPHPWRIP